MDNCRVNGLGWWFWSDERISKFLNLTERKKTIVEKIDPAILRLQQINLKKQK